MTAFPLKKKPEQSQAELHQYLPEVFDRTDTVFGKTPLSNWCDGHVPTQLRDILAHLPKGAIVAGAYLTDLWRGQTPKDLDVFFLTSEYQAKGSEVAPAVLQAAIRALTGLGYRFSEGAPTKGCLDFTKPGNVPVQLVKFRTYADVSEVLDGFDFTAAQLATDGEFLYFGPTTVYDLKNGLLRIHRLEHDHRTVHERVLRYLSKGYTIGRETFLKLCPREDALQFAGLDIGKEEG